MTSAYSGWRTMDDAPRDGTDVLTFTPVENHRVGIICGMHVGFFHPDFQEWCQSDLEWRLEPTHWMPLPDPPVVVAHRP